MAEADYPIEIRSLSLADGGGYLAIVPDLPGCASDGETPEEAAHNALDAIVCWFDAARRLGRPIPQPSKHRALA